MHQLFREALRRKQRIPLFNVTFAVNNGIKFDCIGGLDHVQLRSGNPKIERSIHRCFVLFTSSKRPDRFALFCTQLRAYQIRNGRQGKVLNFKIVDTMGLEEERKQGFDPSELSYVLDGHVPENHQVYKCE